MRRLALAFALAALVPAAAMAQSLSVNLNQTARITLAHPAVDVIVGNPSIADVTVLDAHHLMLTGKSYGVTNLMVVDDTGHASFSRQVVVAAPDGNQVSLYRGSAVSTYACAQHCERTAAGATPAAQ